MTKCRKNVEKILGLCQNKKNAKNFEVKCKLTRAYPKEFTTNTLIFRNLR